MKIALVIEEDPESVKLLKAILERWDIAISPVTSTAKAEEMLRTVLPDVILCDIGVRGTDALTFIRWLRSSGDPKLSKMPVIGMTVLYEDIDARTARAAGFDVFLRKPLDPDQLPHVVALLIAGPTRLGPGGA
jgi:CheY-like chemotaxis protein